MTRTEIERQALSLPEPERAALASQLVASIEDPRQLGMLAPEVNDAYKAKIEAWGNRLSAEAEGWFDGEARELTDADWDHILSAERTQEELDRPMGTGVPLEWAGRPLRELHEATTKKRP